MTCSPAPLDRPQAVRVPSNRGESHAHRAQAPASACWALGFPRPERWHVMDLPALAWLLVIVILVLVVLHLAGAY